jgi:hypothetical protein
MEQLPDGKHPRHLQTGHAYPDIWCHRQSETHAFTPVFDKSIPPAQRFNTATPAGTLSIDVDNPTVLAAWTPLMGKLFTIQITAPPGK